jgi:prepilin-type N-terminal cleavage/methylation domain-containing protein
MKSNQKGFSVVEILIVIVVVGLLGAVGWLLYDRQQSKSSNASNQQDSTSQKVGLLETEQKGGASEAEKVKEFSATSFSLDVSKLPKSWIVLNNAADVVTITTDGCFIEATKENDATLSSSKKAEGTKALLTANDRTTSKGYAVTEKGTSTLTVYTAAGAEKVTSYEFLWDMSGGGNPFRYSKSYSVQDGYYISIKRSCSSETGFADTDAAMDAITFEQ